MNVDIAALRTIEREKDIPFETVIEAIETALLTAYKHTDGHQPHARIDIDRKSGAVRVMAQELGPDGAVDQQLQQVRPQHVPVVVVILLALVTAHDEAANSLVRQ